MYEWAAVHLQTFKCDYGRWKALASVCKGHAKGACPETEYWNLADKLKSYEKEVIQNFELLRNTCTPNPDVVRKVEIKMVK
jgi:hypothetical protein